MEHTVVLGASAFIQEIGPTLPRNKKTKKIVLLVLTRFMMMKMLKGMNMTKMRLIGMLLMSFLMTFR
jgi:hypothetical protein